MIISAVSSTCVYCAQLDITLVQQQVINYVIHKLERMFPFKRENKQQGEVYQVKNKEGFF